MMYYYIPHRYLRQLPYDWQHFVIERLIITRPYVRDYIVEVERVRDGQRAEIDINFLKELADPDYFDRVTEFVSSIENEDERGERFQNILNNPDIEI